MVITLLESSTEEGEKEKKKDGKRIAIERRKRREEEERRREEELDRSGKEEGESELLCYYCGMNFRTRKYFLRHHDAHIDAELCGVNMPENSWKGQVGHESEDSFSEEEERTPLPQKRKRRKKKKELRYGT